MPIILDTENPEQLVEQMRETQLVEKNTRVLDGKYFSKNLTGNGKRKSGILGVDSDVLPEFYDTRQRLVGLSSGHVHNLTAEHIRNESYATKFFRKTKENEPDWRQYEHFLTTIAPPSALLSLLETPVSPELVLSFPRDTDLYDLKVVDSTNIWYPLASGTIDGHDATTYARVLVESASLYHKEENSTKSTAMSIEPYLLLVTMRDDMQMDGYFHFLTGANHKKDVDARHGIASLYALTTVPGAMYDVKAVRQQIVDHINTVNTPHTSLIAPRFDEVDDYLKQVSVASAFKVQATNAGRATDNILLTLSDYLGRHMNGFRRKDNYQGVDRATLDVAFRQTLIAFIQHIDIINGIEEDLVSTELLASIHGNLNRHLNDATLMNDLTRHSLRLLLSQRLNELRQMNESGGLHTFEQKDDAVRQAMLADPNYSVYQKNIIGTTHPLVIAQAGAGSGKSHTLVKRVNYMRDQGEDLSKALVLSFTNVAAKNIVQRCPGIRSETLANMFNNIYTNTFPSQALSQPSTVANSLRLLNPNSVYFQQLGYDGVELAFFIRELSERLEQFDSTGYKRVDLQQELKHMANLVEKHLKMTCDLLSAVEATTLELQPIIIHTMLLADPDSMNVPDEYKTLNYIITDESQDISTFEYILLLELTLHHGSQLLIIGDGSQTLYEFRNSDPRYMNALESSGVFKSYKLETNYRSQEEILMYANQFLKVIDANKFANIQLASASFRKADPVTFTDTVSVLDNPNSGKNEKEYRENLLEFLADNPDFEDWFIARMKRGEQVALMAWTRKEVLEVSELMENMLKKHGLSIPVTNIMSDNERPMTILSRFASAKEKTIRAMDPTNPTYLSDMTRLANQFVNETFTNSSSKQTSYFVDKIRKAVETVMYQPQWHAWVADFKNKTFDSYQVGSLLCRELLRIETRNNATEQFLRKKTDIPNYDQCQFIVSTIHGTKGLEFDHTIVVYNESKRGATSQETLRMMFVALSRAKQSELVINTHNPAPTRVVSDAISAMFQTPINTAYRRTLNDINVLNGITAAPDTDEEEDAD